MVLELYPTSIGGNDTLTTDYATSAFFLSLYFLFFFFLLKIGIIQVFFLFLQNNFAWMM